MVTLKNRFTLAFLVVFLGTGLSYTAKSNSPKRSQLQQDIAAIETVIFHNNIEKDGVFNEIHNLTMQIAGSERIVRLILTEESIDNRELDELEMELNSLVDEVANASRLYQKILLEEYKHRNYKSKLVFLVSSKSINQFISRLSQLKRLKSFRMRQLQTLVQKRKEVQDKLLVYNGTKEDREILVARKQEERSKIQFLIEEKNTALREIEKENNMLQMRLNEAKRNLRKLEQEVRSTIDAGESIASGVTHFHWPVETGLVVGRFGVQNHQTIYNIQVENNGMDFLVPQDEPIVAIGTGVVKSIFDIPGSNSSIIIDHGEFFSVYTNVKTPLVYEGANVDLGTQIATISKNDENLYKLHFELWKGRQKVNPEDYLTPR